jgi:hypothetical protein
MAELRPDQPRQGGLSRRPAEDRFQKPMPAHVVFAYVVFAYVVFAYVVIAHVVISYVVISYVVMQRRTLRPDRHEPFPAIEDWHALFIEARGNAHRLTSESHEAARSRSCSR